MRYMLKINSGRIFSLLLVLLTFIGVNSACASQRTFNSGSYVFSADSCWQPNNDPSNVAQTAVCDTNKNDKSLFQLYGLLYAVLDTGDQPDLCKNINGTAPQQKAMLGYCKQIKIYWIIDSTKTDPQAADLTLSTTDTALNTSGIITIYNSAKTKAGDTTTSVPYKGGPFVIDGNDLTAAEFAKIAAKFPDVKIHKANIPFSGNVDKVLIGKPPKIAVLDEGSSDVLADYIRASGLSAWQGTVFQNLSARDVLAGCLQDPIPASCTTKRSDISAPFQLVWAPHWEIENKWSDNSTPTAAEQTSVVSEIRSFLEKGNSGFFECASIGSLEGSKIKNNIGMSISAGMGGYLVSKSNVSPRIENNAGCYDKGTCTTGYVKHEQVPSWLTQCGGWNYKPTSGLIDSMRPIYNSTTPANSYTYLTTQKTDDAATVGIDDRYTGSQLTRFLHDDVTKLNSAYTTDVDGYHVFDYLVGGRINGSPTQGYLIYFPGHKYISCSNSTNLTYPPSRSLEFTFDSKPDVTIPITIEVEHAMCTKGSNCPKVTFNLANGKGTNFSDTYIDLSAEFATYDALTNKLEGVFFTSNFVDGNAALTISGVTKLLINNVYTTFDVATGVAKLVSIVDLTDQNNRLTLCSPGLASKGVELSCSGSASSNDLTISFDGDVKTGTQLVTVTAKTAAGSAVATYDLATSSGTTVTGGGIVLDLTSAVYNSTSYKLSNVKIRSSSACTDVTLTDFTVAFPGGAVKLLQVYNETTKIAVCSPSATSTASCSGSAVAPSANSKTTLAMISFDKDYLDSQHKNATKITMKITFKCQSGCTGTGLTVQNTFDTSVYPNVGEYTTDTGGLLAIDTRTAVLLASDGDSDKLEQIKLINLNDTNSLRITKIEFTFAALSGNGSNTQKVSKFKDTTNDQNIVDSKKSSVAVYDSISYDLTGSSSTTTTSWSYNISGGSCSNTYFIGPYLSSCTINWNSSNTCGVKYILNTMLALKYTIVTSEFSKTQPIVKDNILYKASYDFPVYRGHLKMIKVPTNTQTSAETVWDAATAMPKAGVTGFASAPLASTDTTSPRYIFTTASTTNLTPISFDPDNAATLKGAMSIATDNTAKVWINTIRGRKGASEVDTYSSTSNCSSVSGNGITDDLFGCDEDSKRLWAIENSTPALKTKSKYVESTATAVTTAQISAGKDRRDRFLFAGADDGMMHAFHAGKYDPSTGTYPDDAGGKGTGKEVWAYLPSILLPNLLSQKNFIDSTSGSSPDTPAISADGSPALGDFLICTTKNTLTNTCSKWEWKTRLVGTAAIRSENHGIIFALDVTDPYDPKVLWESKYDKTTDTGCLADKKNCNMGESKGVAIGTAQIGDVLKDYVFLTSNWIQKKKLVGSTYTVCATDTTGCVYGVSAFALDLDTGQVKWEKSIPYSSSAGDIVAPPAMPALMDRDNNGSYDYVVFGDMQGRLWALRTTDGVNLTGDNPVYEVMALDSAGKDTTTKAGYKEPIGAPVSVYRDYVVLATGGTDYASNGAIDSQKYRIEVVKIGLSGATKVNGQSVVLEGYDSTNKIGSEQVWAKPAITSDLKVYIGTVRSFSSAADVSKLESTGRVIVLDLKIPPGSGTTPANVSYVGGTGSEQWHDGGFVGGFDFDNKHAYIVTLKPSKDASGKNVDIVQIGSENDFTKSVNKANPYKILWWRKM